MGYIRHHTIVVTSWSESEIKKAHHVAQGIFEQVSEVIEAPVNSYFSFFIPPDGSKEGWAASDKGDLGRKKFKEYLRSTEYDDGSCSLDWVELFYGDDNGEVAIVDHDNKEED